jgi:hypothetical protein
MKIPNVKTMIARSVTVGLVAAAFALAAPAKADAQQFAVGVQVGYPHGYYGPDYYARLRVEQERRRDEWAHARHFDRYHHGYYGRR